MKKRLFISHASEDKNGFVRPLAEALRTEFDVWYDEYELVVGMSLLEEISKGLATCDYGIVVLSTSFFEKKWTQSELNGLFSLEEKDRKVILPVWHNLEQSEVKKQSPILADRVAAKSEDGIDAVVKEIKRSVTYFERGKAVQASKAGVTKLKSALQRKAEEDRSKRIVNSSEGVLIAGKLGKQTIELLTSNVIKLIEEGAVGLRVNGPNQNDGPCAGVMRCSVEACVGELRLRAEYHNIVVNSARDARLRISLRTVDMDTWGEVISHSDIQNKDYILFVSENDERFWRAETSKTIITSDDLVNEWLGRFSDQLVK